MIRVLAAFVAVGLAACQGDPGERGPPDVFGQPVEHVYRAVGEEQLRAYVFLPDEESGPGENSAVLLFHGGGWSVGEPEWTFDAARRFASWGMVAASIQYRLSGGELTPIDALADACAAFVWVRQHAEDLGVDPGRVAGYGLSAGGHLAAATATVGCPPELEDTGLSEPDLLLLWSPALDTTIDGWFARLLQGRAEAEAYSPAHHAGASTPPTSIVLGGEDTLTPPAGASLFCRRLTEAGGECEVNVYEGVGHLLTRNLENQESDFDPDPTAVADGISRHRQFLLERGYIRNRGPGGP